MNKQVLDTYRKFRREGHKANYALYAAKTVEQFNDLEAEDKVRLTAKPEEESYFDVYGRPDTEKEEQMIRRDIERYGLWVVSSEYKCGGCSGWAWADGIGMIMAHNPTSPFENCYVVDLMSAAIQRAKGTGR